MRLRSTCLAFCLGLCASATYAARPYESREEATHIVIGHVRAIYSRETQYNRHYLVEIVIEKVEKGDSLKSGDAIEVSCYQPKPATGRETKEELEQRSFGVDGGHKEVPTEGDQVRVYAKRFQAIYQGVFPDWVDILKRSESKPATVSAASMPMPIWPWAIGGLVAGLVGGFCVSRLWGSRLSNQTPR